MEAALQLTREQELSRLSVQAVADALDVSRSPIYAFFPTVEALRAEVVDHLLGKNLAGEIPGSVSWSDKLRLFSFRIFEVYDEYPGTASELFRTGFPDTDTGRRAAKAIVRILSEAGATAEQVQMLIHAVVALAVGSVMQIHGSREREKRLLSASAEEIAAEDRRRGDTLPSKPLGRSHYKAALEVLIAGIEESVNDPADERDEASPRDRG